MAVIEKLVTLAGSKGKKGVVALFDSGATYSCIRPDLAIQLGLAEALPEPSDFETAKDGEKVTATERVSLNFHLEGLRFSDEFMLVPHLSEQVLIGAATLQKWRMKLDFEQDKVIVDPRVTKLRLL
jgi:hypothetical protein